MTLPKIVSDWTALQAMPAREWQCGNCGKHVSERRGFHTSQGNQAPHPQLFPCPNCGFPTLFYNGQHPGIRPGRDVDHLPPDVERVYRQARDCCAIGAFDGAALLARSLLMHVAVDRGAKPGLTFVEYVDFLEQGHFTPPDSQPWVDHIRTQGNRAAHKIDAASAKDATELIDFLELILLYLFEFQGRMAAKHGAAGKV